MEQPYRPALDNHVHWTSRPGAWVLISELWYETWRRSAESIPTSEFATFDHEPNICGLSDESILEIVYSNDSVRKLAAQYDISQGSVRRIFIKFDKELPRVKRKRLTGREIEEICVANRPQSTLSKEYGVTQSYISQISYGKNAYVRQHRKRLDANHPVITAPVVKPRRSSLMTKLLPSRSEYVWGAASLSVASFLCGSGLIMGIIFVAGLIA